MVRDTYNGKHPKRIKQPRKVKKRLKTIVNTQVRELERKMNEEQKARYEKDFSLYKQAANQQQGDANKVYSLFTNHLRVVLPKASHINNVNLETKWD